VLTTVEPWVMISPAGDNEGPPGHHARREDARPKARQPFVIGTRSGHMPVFVETADVETSNATTILMDIILGYPEQYVGNG
jgi:hypothetical protein